MSTNKTQYKTALIFDLDGTLIDSRLKTAKDVQHVYRQWGAELPLEDILDMSDFSKPAEQYGHTRKEFGKMMLQHMKPWQEALREGDVIMYDDVEPALEHLTGEGYRIHLATRSRPEFTQAKVDHFGLGKYFRTIQVVDVDKKRFPTKKTAVRDALDHDYAQHALIMNLYFVGDSEADDLGTAEELKKDEDFPFPVFGVYANRAQKPLKRIRPDYTVDTMTELIEILHDNA